MKKKRLKQLLVTLLILQSWFFFGLVLDFSEVKKMDPITIAALVGGGVSLANGIVNTWFQKKNQDYQKSVQQDVFAREDTAVLRRMEDLKKSGLNPYMASGQSAGAGSVVNTQPLSFDGSALSKALDTVSAVQSIKQMKYQTENLKQQNENMQLQNALLQQDGIVKSAEAGLAKVRYAALTGRDEGFYWHNSNNELEYRDFKDMPYYHMVMNDVNDSNNNSQLLKKNLDYYDANEIMSLLGSVFPGINSYANLRKSLKNK